MTFRTPPSWRDLPQGPEENEPHDLQVDRFSLDFEEVIETKDGSIRRRKGHLRSSKIQIPAWALWGTVIGTVGLAGLGLDHLFRFEVLEALTLLLQRILA